MRGLKSELLLALIKKFKSECFATQNASVTKNKKQAGLIPACFLLRYSRTATIEWVLDKSVFVFFVW
jgi:hypothetical protein